MGLVLAAAGVAQDLERLRILFRESRDVGDLRLDRLDRGVLRAVP